MREWLDLRLCCTDMRGVAGLRMVVMSYLGALYSGLTSSGSKLWMDNLLSFPGVACSLAMCLAIAVGLSMRQIETMLSATGFSLQTLIVPVSAFQRSRLATIPYFPWYYVGWRRFHIYLGFRTFLV